jgi:hypothetical protein
MDHEHRFSMKGTGKGEEDAPFRERLRKADQALANRYPQLTKKVGEAEEYLRRLHLPEPIFLPYNDEGVPNSIPSGVSYSWDCLAFRRHKGEWRLCYARCHSHQPEDGEEPSWKPVVECATDVRVDAIAQLGKLKLKALECKEKYVAKVDKALGDIDDFLSD